MKDRRRHRRQFIKLGITCSLTGIISSLFSSNIQASTNFPNKPTMGTTKRIPPVAGIIFTEHSPGRWASVKEEHIPRVHINGHTIQINNSHVMSQNHYIARHTLISPTGDLLGEKTFSPDDKEALSIFDIPNWKQYSYLYALSYCNRHDLWMTEIDVSFHKKHGA